MMTAVKSTNAGLNLTISAMTIAQLGSVVAAYFGAFPDSELTLSHDDQGYIASIASYPVVGNLTALITSLQAVKAVTG